MLKQSELDRINELAKLKKERELTDSEIAEQKVLREKFLEDFRARFKAQLDNIELVDEDDPRLAKQRGENKH